MTFYEVVATTLELWPARVDVVSAVLQGAGLGSLFGTAVAMRARARMHPTPDSRPLVERYSVLGGCAGAVVFAVLKTAHTLG